MRREFEGRHFEGEVILWAVRRYCRYGIGYRELAAILAERGVAVDHTTIHRRAQRHAPEIEARLRRIWRASSLRRDWRADGTYVKVRGRRAYLYRAVDEEGRTPDFHLSPTRSARAAKRFLGEAIRACKEWEKPLTLTTDKAPTYPLAIAELEREGRCPPHVAHRRAKYLNNVIEADHGQPKRLIRPTLGFEVMRALKKGQGGSHQVQDGVRGEVRSVERAFGIGPDALSEMFDRLQALDLAA